jgi:hypothetical protein
MGERKVLNKYYPPDFDPTLIPRNRKPKDRKYTVNLMMPMTIQCSACGQFMYMGKKVNGMKEMVVGESYLGIAIHRCVGSRFLPQPTRDVLQVLLQMRQLLGRDHVQDGPKEPRLRHGERVRAHLHAALLQPCSRCHLTFVPQVHAQL